MKPQKVKVCPPPSPDDVTNRAKEAFDRYATPQKCFLDRLEDVEDPAVRDCLEMLWRKVNPM